MLWSARSLNLGLCALALAIALFIAIIDSRRLRVYIYDFKGSGHDAADELGDVTVVPRLTRRFRESEYAWPDGDTADYYFIPTRGHFDTQQQLLAHLNVVRTKYPWFNRTRDAGQVRHYIFFPGDGGPGSVAFNNPTKCPDPEIPEDINPACPGRALGMFLNLGMRTGADLNQSECVWCFQAKKDIFIPILSNVCAALCGWVARVAKSYVRGYVISQMQQLFADFVRPSLAPMQHPDATEYTGRGGIYAHYRNKPGYKIVRSGEDKPVPFAPFMRRTDWCYSPVGQSGGVPDRYHPAILHGCLPVMQQTIVHATPVPVVLPFEDILPWHLFSTLVHVRHLDHLEKQLECLKPYVKRMRANLRGAWTYMMYSSIYGPFVGEDGGNDAFEGIIRVLTKRRDNNWTVDAETYSRITEREKWFPCILNSTATDLVGHMTWFAS
ncbi:hypothetical protein HYH03_013203 [Edaphochlamys debaryana]|uniref:Exostosin GT47 domain-containing protein n=1 Tax=Edaphochlamys debaryana TaxID=47281 RepID=A0A835XYY6_9CHLO|nr:hypothetical protein HYH03_013203 [Edaphochlamys debaryana]|eukprot:KAG2488209.1 hypothetical protein HYH03_013203 [Edaphochlamys debaryana]